MYKTTISRRKKVIIVGIVLFCSAGLSQPAFAQFVSGSTMVTTISETTPVFFFGDINLSGFFQGFKIDYPIYLSDDQVLLLEHYFPSEDVQDFLSMDDLYAFPLFQGTTIHDVTVHLVNTSILSALNHFSPDEILEKIDFSLKSFSNVSVHIKKGIALFCSNNESIRVQLNKSYGIGGLFQFPFPIESSTTGLGIISYQESIMESKTDTSVLIPFESDIQIITGDKKNLTVSDPNILILIKTRDSVILHQDSILHFFPIVSNGIATAEATITVTESKLFETNPLSLLTEANDRISEVNNTILSDLFLLDPELDSIITLVSYILNSGIVIFNSSQPVMIDDVQIPSASILAGRGPEYSITLNHETVLPVLITGTSSLIFLNDHIHTSSAKTVDKGITLPFWSILLWIAAIVSILYYWTVKKQHLLRDEDNNEPKLIQKKWFRALLYSGVILICFVLIDLEFSFRFGVSYFTLLSLQVELLFIIIFLLVQILILILLFTLYALPALLVHNMIFRTLIKNEYRFLTKLVVPIALLWIGIQIYFLVLFNIFLSMIPISSFTGFW
ncbi:MAG: hypothetical protein QCI00_00650 [Candidatus Thermoplasmatota archaeon]|nr:hypothetical protein [Candidatus Thermoplasmatota archaeon]